MEPTKKQEFLERLEAISNQTQGLFNRFNDESRMLHDEVRRIKNELGVDSLDDKTWTQIRNKQKKSKIVKQWRRESELIEKRLKKMRQAISDFKLSEVLELENCGLKVTRVTNNLLLLRAHSHEDLAFCAEDKCQWPHGKSPRGKSSVMIKTWDLEVRARLKGSFKKDQLVMAEFFALCRKQGIKALFCDQTGVTELTKAKKDLHVTDIEIFLASDAIKVLEQMKGKCAACHHNCPDLFSVR
jgi:hypothetical protein